MAAGASASSRSSLKSRPRGQERQQHEKSHAAKQPVSLNTRARHLRDSDDGSSSDGDDHTPGGRLVTQNRKTRRATTNNTKTLIASKSLPNLVVRAKNNSSSSIFKNSKKRPRFSSPSPSPSHSPPPPRSSPRRPPKRAPLTTTKQQTTLDNFLANGARKDSNHVRESTEKARPAKKPRLGEATINPTTTTATTHQLLQDRESPDPLNFFSPPSSPGRVRARHRANTATSTTATTTNHAETIPSSPSLLNRAAARSTRNKTVVIADDAVTKTNTGEDVQQQPTGQASQAPEKRSLRSHDGGSRSKSELAQYFPNYEQIISLEPVKPEFLAPSTTVILLDDLTESPLPPSSLEPTSPSRKRKQRKHSEQTISPFGNPLLELHGVERIVLPRVHTSSVTADPLSDDVYFKAHRRHERQEKQLRNIEKERAQHEKIQLDRLLDELQGHDWLRVMGISGITDTEKKLYEPKRDYFVKEVLALIDKFRVWKEEEKRRKSEREKMLLEAAAAAEEEEGEEEEEEEEEEEVEVEVEDASEDEDVHVPSSNKSFDSSELDAAAAEQLIQEARSATATATATPKGQMSSTPPKPRRRLIDSLTATPPKSRSVHDPPDHNNSQQQEPTKVGHDKDQPAKPFVSFYSKRHLRDAAFSSSRRGGRNRSAFGQPLPELEEHEFQLPADILTADIVHALERKRRRLKRESRG